MNRLIPLVALVVITLSGCGSVKKAAERAKLSNELKMLGIAYLNYNDANQKGPTSWQDLQQIENMTEVQKAVQTAGYTVIWGLKPSEAKEGTSNTVVAYPANGTTTGGPVLFLDGSVQQLTGAELSEKLKNAPAP